MDVKIYNPIVKINISVFLINMLKVYTNSHPASHKGTKKEISFHHLRGYLLQVMKAKRALYDAKLRENRA